MIYTDVSRKYTVTANLAWVCVYIYMLHIYYIYNTYQVYTRYIPGLFAVLCTTNGFVPYLFLYVIYYVYLKNIQCKSQGYSYNFIIIIKR